jgi:hypothetical protein
MKRLFFLLLIFCKSSVAQNKLPTVQQQVWSLTEVMFHDVTNPPAAARFYAYSALTAYEILSQLDDSMVLFQDQFKNYPSARFYCDRSAINKQLAVTYGILETGKSMMPSGYLLQEKEAELLRSFAFLSTQTIDSSVALAKKVAQKIIDYSKSDGYFKLSTLSRYKPLAGDEYWQPTPPEYMSAIEPHWQIIRTFFLDSVEQVPLKPMIVFEKQTGSSFYQLANEVYNTTNSLTDEQKLIANFWDCNPFAVQYQGHMSVGLKKISPGGHWMGITGIVCEQANLDLRNTVLLHTLVALALHDAFICCWNGKYRYNRIRPETVINRYIDEKWQPLLQTPPFPEYPSGHSVISTAAAGVLTQFFGDHFSFVDTVETYLGLPPRQFNSFSEAAAEARISRLYGGIHFRDAIENGREEGEEIGAIIIFKTGLKALSSAR